MVWDEMRWGYIGLDWTCRGEMERDGDWVRAEDILGCARLVCE